MTPSHDALARITKADIAAAQARIPRAFSLTPKERYQRRLIWAALIGLVVYCLFAFNFSPVRIVEGLSRLGRVASFMFPPHIWTEWDAFSEVLKGLGETVAMAFMGTLLGALIAFPLSFLGAKNINSLTWFRLSTRRGFDILRAVEQLILALIFIRAFGLGPLAGVLAIAVSDIGTCSKLFSEAIENTSEKPVDGVKASGGSRLQNIRFGTLPQALPVIFSIILYQLESNTRSGTILGIVGAGGIGFILADRIAAYRWDEAWSIIFLIILTVYLIDGISARLRMRIIGRWEGKTV